MCIDRHIATLAQFMLCNSTKHEAHDITCYFVAMQLFFNATTKEIASVRVSQNWAIECSHVVVASQTFQNVNNILH
jgi:hypothetical protein